MPWTKPYKPSNNLRLEPEFYERPDLVTFITIRAYGNQAPFLHAELNCMILATLQQEQDRLDCMIFTYCLMPDHLHYLISPKNEGVSVLKFTDQFKGKTTNSSWKLGRHGKLWQPRCYDHIVRQDEDLRRIADYILNNPVRKGIVSNAEEWPWNGEMNPLPLVG
jgi:REP element-mobilizing transposase RayT